MAENGTGGKRFDPEKPEAPPARSEEKGSGPSGEEERTETALVDALRAFVKRVPREGESSSTESIGKRQAMVLVLFSVDIALVYSLLSHWLQGVQDLVYQELLKVVPWMLGATAVSYAGRIRRFLLEQARHWKWATAAAVLAMFLLIIHMPIFSLNVRVPTAAFRVKAEDSRMVASDEGSGLYRLVFPSLDAFRITVMGPEEKKDYWVALPMTLGRLRILQTTLAGAVSHVPFAGRVLSTKELTLAPLYNVPTESDWDAEVHVEGDFAEGFFQEMSLKQAGCRPAGYTKEGHRAARCPVGAGGGGFALPGGDYDFTLVRIRDRCQYHWPTKYHVWALQDVMRPTDKNELVDFNKLCAK